MIFGLFEQLTQVFYSSGGHAGPAKFHNKAFSFVPHPLGESLNFVCDSCVSFPPLKGNSASNGEALHKGGMSCRISRYLCADKWHKRMPWGHGQFCAGHWMQRGSHGARSPKITHERVGSSPKLPVILARIRHFLSFGEPSKLPGVRSKGRLILKPTGAPTQKTRRAPDGSPPDGGIEVEAATRLGCSLNFLVFCASTCANLGGRGFLVGVAFCRCGCGWQNQADPILG